MKTENLRMKNTKRKSCHDSGRIFVLVDLYGVELLGRDLFFELSPLVAAVQHLQHDSGSKPEPTDEHLALAQIVQL